MTTGSDDGPPVWSPAITLVDDITRHTEAGAVIRAAHRAGLFDLLRRPSPVAALAGAVVGGHDEARVAAVLEVLRSLAVAEETADGWSLTAAWAAVLDGESPADLAGYLEGPRVRMKHFEECLSGGTDYAQLSADDRLVIARAVSFNPSSPLMPEILRRDLGLLDGVVPALDAGGRVLELGCGVGSRLTALALTFPELCGVGVELDPELVAFGRRRAAALGVADRVTYVIGDAADYDARREFDLVNWSQFFFPTPTRGAALATARRALRPGGWITAPVIWPDEPGPPVGAAAQDLALEGVMLHMWGVPSRTTGQVRAEFEAAGFVDTRVDDMRFIKLVRGRRPTADR